MSDFRVTRRGTLCQLANADGTAIDAALYGCRVIKPPYDRNGKTYMELDVTGCSGDMHLVAAVNDFIRATARASFSPLRVRRPSTPGAPDATQTLIVKLTRATKYETAAAVPGFAFTPGVGDAVDVVVGPGAFGQFGYCVLVKRMKPHLGDGQGSDRSPANPANPASQENQEERPLSL